MSRHKSEDYKITAVKYYLENNTNYAKTCEIFKCSERSLKRCVVYFDFGRHHILIDQNVVLTV
jgi:transposase-like protein